MPQSIQDILARIIITTDYEKLSKEVIHQAKRTVLDLIGVAYAGRRIGMAPMVKEVFGQFRGRPEATVFGDDNQLPVPFAAMINAVSGHTLDMDDGHRYANAHIGVVTIPPALAIAEKENLTGRELIEAIVAGYEIMIRLAMAINPTHLDQGFHTTSTLGAFASAAVAAKLLKLTETQTANALSLAALQSSGLLEALQSGQMSKPYQVGCSVYSGTMAGILAGRGGCGPELAFEGRNGFLKAYAAGRTIEEKLGPPDAPAAILSIYFKQHAACRHTHAAIDAVKDLVERMAIDPESIESIEVKTYGIAKRLVGKNSGGESELAAKFSLPVALGLLLVHGSVAPHVFQPQYVADHRVQQLAGKVKVIESAEWNALLPSVRGAEVIIDTPHGHFNKSIRSPKGDPENPLTDDELSQKFIDNLKEDQADEQIGRLIKRIFLLDEQSLQDLLCDLKRPSRGSCG